MLRWRKRIRRMTYIVTDAMCILLASILVNVFYTNIWKRQLNTSYLEHVGFLSMSALIFMGSFLLLSVYDTTIEDRGRLKMKSLFKMFIAYMLSVMVLGAGLFYMHVELSRLYIGLYTIVIIVLQLINRWIMKITQFKGNDRTEAMRNILVVGHSDKGQLYIDEINKHDYLNFNIIGYVSIKEANTYPNVRNLGTIDELEKIAVDYVIDEITVARPLNYDERLDDTLCHCQQMGITVTMLLDVHNDEKVQVAMVGRIPVLKLHTVCLNETQLFMKRMLDIAGAMVGMIIFGMAYMTIGPLIKIETPGPVIFKQNRVGKNGRVFQVWKFRSMGADAEARKAALAINNEMTGHMFKMTDDPRITRIGAFIRKTSIDELPQFYNVLKGDMSLVGTRPPTVDEVEAYEQHHRRRICITPGITGNWQVSGRSDIEEFEEVVRLDSAYIENWSIWSDLRILLKTVKVVLVGRGSR